MNDTPKRKRGRPTKKQTIIEWSLHSLRYEVIRTLGLSGGDDSILKIEYDEDKDILIARLGNSIKPIKLSYSDVEFLYNNRLTHMDTIQSFLVDMINITYFGTISPNDNQKEYWKSKNKNIKSEWHLDSIILGFFIGVAFGTTLTYLASLL